MKTRMRVWLLQCAVVLPALFPVVSRGDQLTLTPPTTDSQFYINDPTIWFSPTFQQNVVPMSTDDLVVNAGTLVGNGAVPPIVLLVDDYSGDTTVATLAFSSLTIEAGQGLTISRDGSADAQLVLGTGIDPTVIVYDQQAPVQLSANISLLGTGSLTDQLTIKPSDAGEVTTLVALGLQIAGLPPTSAGSLVVGAKTSAEVDGIVTVLADAATNVITVSGNATASGGFTAGGIVADAASANTLLSVAPFGSIHLDGPITSTDSVGTVLHATGGSAALQDIQLHDIVGTIILASGSAQVTTGAISFFGQAGGTLIDASGSATVTTLDVTGSGVSHLTGPVVSATGQSTVTVGNVTVQDGDAVLFTSTSIGKVTVGNVMINGNLLGDVIHASGQATIDVGTIDVGLGGQMSGSLVVASGAGTRVTFGDVGNLLRHEGAVDFFVYPNFGTTMMSVTGGAFVKGGLVFVNSLDALQGILVDGGSTLELDGLWVPSATNSSILVEGASRLTIGNSTNFGTFTHPISSGEEGTLQISVFASSILNTPAGIDIQALHPNIMTIDHSEWDGNSNYSYFFQSQGGNDNAILNVENTSTLNNLDFQFWYGSTANIDHTTLNNVSMSVQFGSLARVTSATWKNGQISLADNNTNAGQYNGSGIFYAGSSQLFDLVVLTAANTGGTAQIILDNTIANMGEIQASVSDATGGLTTVTVRNQSQLWTYTSLDLGASKRAPNFGIWPVITSHTGTAHLLVQSGGRVVVGGSVRADGSFSTFTSDTSVTLGAGSDITIDSTSAMYVGRIFSPGQAIFNLGALTLGAKGWIFGDGTIIGDLYNFGGKVLPGFSPGELTIDGAFVQNAGEVDIEIGGPGAGEYDQIIANSFAFHGGTIVVSLYGDGYTGADLAGHTLTFFAGGPISLSNTQFVDQTGLGLQLVNGGVTIPSVPEPGTLGVLGLGVVGFLRRRGNGRTKG